MSPHELTTSAQISWKTISPGGTIMNAGNAEEFNTGDWRSYKPLFIKENCKQCLLCYPACPDSSIPINEQGERGEFDYKHCKGCGVCENVCPFNAIEMKENS
ncbi:MAG: 4Fe-4S binding protein [Clostridiales bacterium]|nr:4Fe-4S binding protein [Clostridiales bacterium]